jgi:hypothetical protein
MRTKSYILFLFVLALLSSFRITAQDNKPTESTISYTAVIAVGTEFKYQVIIKTLIAVQPTGYKLVKFPEGMTIDEKTGIIKWVPKAKGEFSIEAEAYVNTSKIGNMIIRLKVVDILGAVTGIVKSSDDKVLPYSIITLYKKVTVNGKPDSYAASYSGSTDANGIYKISNVELGTYLIHAMTRQTEANVLYESVYYVNSTTIEKATPITVSNATPVEVNFKLQKTIITPTIFTTYSTTMKVGTEFKYQVEIKLPDGVTSALYRLTARPDGMTIDEKTGLVKWVPKVKGEFGAQVTVTSNDQKIALINMKLTVYSFAGSITGSVTNTESKPIQYVTVTLYKKTSTAEKPNAYVNSFSAMTDASGKYTIANVDSGVYYAYARAGYEKTMTSVTPITYLPIYYDNAETIDKATPVLVVNTTPVTINFTLQKYVVAEPIKVKLSGMVTDVSGKAIAGAKILVSQTRPASTSNSMMDGINFLLAQGACVSSIADILTDTKTDMNGNFTIALITGNSYIVSCSAEGFLSQYYNGKSNVLDANKILLKRDTTGIDFKLNAVPAAKAVVSGIVADSLKSPVTAKVILYTMSPATNLVDKGTRSVSTNEKGEFKFEKVPNGKYYLQVVPLKDFVPAYYKQSDCGVREARLADVITVANDVNVSNLTVCVKKAKVSGGGKISGFIKNYYGEPVGGVIVIAESSSGEDLSFDISDTDGSYEIQNLGVGVYSVYSDKVGYSNSFANNAVIDYTKNEFNTQVDLIVNVPAITDVKNISALPTQFELMQNYPNPFNPSTVISWQIMESSQVTLKVYDMLGREVVTLVDRTMQPGIYSSQFSIHHSQLSSGVYYYTLRAGNFIQTKKMMLIK